MYVAQHSQPPSAEMQRNSKIFRPVLRILPINQLLKQEKIFLEAANRGDKSTVSQHMFSCNPTVYSFLNLDKMCLKN